MPQSVDLRRTTTITSVLLQQRPQEGPHYGYAIAPSTIGSLRAPKTVPPHRVPGVFLLRPVVRQVRSSEQSDLVAVETSAATEFQSHPAGVLIRLLPLRYRDLRDHRLYGRADAGGIHGTRFQRPRGVQLGR